MVAVLRLHWATEPDDVLGEFDSTAEFCFARSLCIEFANN